MKKNNRNTTLNPKFKNNYAENWAFPIPDVFQDALDIRMTQRTNKATSHVAKVWTQGENYVFKAGYIFYNSIIAYDDWNKFLNGKNPIAVQINDFDNLGDFKQDPLLNSNDLVKIIIYRPNNEKDLLVNTEEHSLTSIQLFNFLQNGILFQSDYAYEK